MLTKSGISKKIVYVFAILVLLASMQSCTDVIELDLNSASPRYVVEGIITDSIGDCKVTITRTVSFNQGNTFPGVSGALVTISDGQGLVTVLQETSPGEYRSQHLVALHNTNYTLTIQIGSETLTALSRMPSPVSLDSLYITEEAFFGSESKVTNVQFTDPAGISNYYNFSQWVNGRRTKELYPTRDELTDGNLQTIKLYMFDAEEDEEIKSGDTIRVEMQCVDADVYKFWYSAQQSATGGSSGAVPANPVSNIRGNALGYFSAHTSQFKTIIAN